MNRAPKGVPSVCLWPLNGRNRAVNSTEILQCSSLPLHLWLGVL